MLTETQPTHRRRRIVIVALAAFVLLVTGVLGVGALGVGGALATHTPQPCADITDVTGDWTGNIVDVEIWLAGTSCTDVIYAVYIYDELGDTGVIAGTAYSGDGTTPEGELPNEERYATLKRDGLRRVRMPNGKAYACAVTYTDPTVALDTWGYPDPPPPPPAPYACTDGFELVRH